MKNHKFFVSTLIAAAAMTAPAYADITVVNTTKDITDSTEMSGTLTLAGVNGAGPGTANILVSGAFDAIIHKNSGGSNGAAGTINIGNAETSVTVVAGRIEMGDIRNSNGSTLNVNSGSTFVVTGNTNTFTGTSSYKSASVVLGEWGAKSTANISGNFFAKDAIVFPGDSGMVLNISGGVFAVKGIGSGVNGSSPRSLALSDNGKIILGDSGISNTRGAWSSSLGAGTIGLSAESTTISALLTVTDTTTGTTFDTTQYEFSGEGASQTIVQGETGGMITLAGGIAGEGLVKVVGAGTLVLGGEIALSSAIQNSAKISVSEGVVFDLSGLEGVAQADGSTLYTLISGTGTSSSTSTLGIQNVDLTGMGIAYRGTSVDFSSDVSSVNVKSGIAGNLVWAGTSDNSTWDSSSTNWTNEGSADTFYFGDNVTFGASAENKSVSFESGAELRVGTATIEAEQDYTFANGVTLSGNTFSIGEKARLNLSAGATYNFNFDNVVLNEGAVVNLSASGGKLLYNVLTMKNGSSLMLTNGNSAGGTVGSSASKILVDAAEGSVSIGGSLYGESTNVQGTITGTGTLNLINSENQHFNGFTVSANITDGENDGDKLALNVNLGTASQTVTISGTNTYSGGTTIEKGTVKLGSAGALGAGSVEVKTNGTLDFNGNHFGPAKGNGDAITLSGGSIVNNGTSVGTDQRQLASVTLTADSSIGGSRNFGIISQGWGASTLDLDGHTLTKTGDNDFWMTGTAVVNAGTIDVQAGRLVLINGANNNNFSMDAGTKIRLGVVGTLHALGVDGQAAGTGTKISLGSVEIVVTDDSKSAARLTNANSTFVIANAAKLYLDIGDLTLTDADKITLTIASENAISSDSFFEQVLVGSYDDQGAWTNSDWYYLADSWNSSTGTLTLTIPEPSAFGLLAGAGALALVASRRRRK